MGGIVAGGDAGIKHVNWNADGADSQKVTVTFESDCHLKQLGQQRFEVGFAGHKRLLGPYILRTDVMDAHRELLKFFGTLTALITPMREEEISVNQRHLHHLRTGLER